MSNLLVFLVCLLLLPGCRTSDSRQNKVRKATGFLATPEIRIQKGFLSFRKSPSFSLYAMSACHESSGECSDFITLDEKVSLHHLPSGSYRIDLRGCKMKPGHTVPLCSESNRPLTSGIYLPPPEKKIVPEVLSSNVHDYNAMALYLNVQNHAKELSTCQNLNPEEESYRELINRMKEIQFDHFQPWAHIDELYEKSPEGFNLLNTIPLPGRKKPYHGL